MSRICQKIHILFNSLPLYGFPYDISKIPANGIYILFEKGEYAHGTNRIVRIGTHSGNNQLRPRLQQHFINENKDRSIFRKNIGRAILNMDKDPYLAKWELDMTTRDAKKKYSGFINIGKQKEIERNVTAYMQTKLNFIAFKVEEKETRMELESKIISTVSSCEECQPSQEWLGRYSPKEKIRESGLWIVNELYKKQLTEEDYIEIERIVRIGGANEQKVGSG